MHRQIFLLLWRTTQQEVEFREIHSSTVWPHHPHAFPIRVQTAFAIKRSSTSRPMPNVTMEKIEYARTRATTIHPQSCRENTEAPRIAKTTRRAPAIEGSNFK